MKLTDFMIAGCISMWIYTTIMAFDYKQKLSDQREYNLYTVKALRYCTKAFHTRFGEMK